MDENIAAMPDPKKSFVIFFERIKFCKKVLMNWTESGKISQFGLPFFFNFVNKVSNILKMVLKVELVMAGLISG